MFCPPPECVPLLVFVAATPFGLIASNPPEQIHRGAGPPSAQPHQDQITIAENDTG
jgi:hypothetical protein